MLKFLSSRRRLAADLVFAVVMGVIYWGFKRELPPIGAEVDRLFIAAYIFLGLGILFFYLVSDINPNLASLVHVGLFPLFNILFLFAKWMPVVVLKIGGKETAFSLGILVYVLTLIAYLNIQLFIHRTGPEPGGSGGF